MTNDSPRATLAGRRLGVYQIQTLLGVGGMGEVYRAHDTRLGRDVALKVLPPQFTSDPNRLARLEQEARALAALNCPNIATIYGLEDMRPSEAASEAVVRALVLELVEGDTLHERIQRAGRGQPAGLPLADILTFARQIADALDAAHEKGIVHRDLKPANIKITPDGVVKVLDFGLAKLVADGASADASTTMSPTVAAANTRDGLIVGTAAYMSPEQARGQAIDKRTDIWAFACVLYEMLTGRAAYPGATSTDILVAVLEREPDWSALPESTPIAIRALLRRCLEKNPRQRLRDIADARHDLENVKGSDPFTDVRATRPDAGRQVLGWLSGVAVVAALGIGVALWWTSGRTGPDSGPAVGRMTIPLPSSLELDMGSGAGPLALAPDGRQLAYVAFGQGRTLLYIRQLDAFDAKAIAGTEGALYPFFSPDGEWVAFFADRKLKKVSIRGGSPLVICDTPTLGRGGTWGADGTIVFDPGDSGLLRVVAEGGRPEPLASRDPAIDKGNLSWPSFLPDGHTLLATLNEPAGVGAELGALSLTTGEWHRLGPGSQPQYLPSGHVVYHAVGVREGELHAVAFDREALSFRGTPVTVVDSVMRAQNGGAVYFATAQNGTLIFTPGGYARTLVSADRNGRRTTLSDDRRGFRHPEMSHDGTKLAVTVDPRPSQIWVFDMSRRSWTRLATESHSLEPIWTPDDLRVIFSAGDLYWRAADAGTPAELLLERDRPQYATSWTPDGKELIFNDGQPGDGTKYDIWAMRIGEKPYPLIVTPNNETSAHISPDGKWIAYDSDESGRQEVYVRHFPNVNEGKWTISTSGGRHPVWAPNGRELYYALGSALFAVSVEAKGHSFVAGAPEMLFSGPFDLLTTDYTLSADGTRFIMIEADPNARPTQIQVVLNWAEEVKRATTRERPD